MKLRLIRDWCVYVVVRLFICMVQAVRIETCVEMCRWLAWLADDVLKIRRKIIDDNIRGAFPQWSAARIDRVRRQMWEHLLVMVCEIAHVPRKLHDVPWPQVRIGRIHQLRDLLLDVGDLFLFGLALLVVAHQVQRVRQLIKPNFQLNNGPLEVRDVDLVDGRHGVAFVAASDPTAAASPEFTAQPGPCLPWPSQ